MFELCCLSYDFSTETPLVREETDGFFSGRTTKVLPSLVVHATFFSLFFLVFSRILEKKWFFA